MYKKLKLFGQLKSDKTADQCLLSSSRGNKATAPVLISCIRLAEESGCTARDASVCCPDGERATAVACQQCANQLSLTLPNCYSAIQALRLLVPQPKASACDGKLGDCCHHSVNSCLPTVSALKLQALTHKCCCCS